MPQKIALGVKGIIMNWRNFLVLEKSKTLFDLPGGRVGIDESSEEGLLREIIEEVDLSVQILGPLAYWSFIKQPGFLVNGVTYLCKYLGGHITLSHEHTRYFWAKIDDLHRINFRPSFGVNNIKPDAIYEKTYEAIYGNNFCKKLLNRGDTRYGQNQDLLQRISKI